MVRAFWSKLHHKYVVRKKIRKHMKTDSGKTVSTFHNQHLGVGENGSTLIGVPENRVPVAANK